MPTLVVRYITEDRLHQRPNRIRKHDDLVLFDFGRQNYPRDARCNSAFVLASADLAAANLAASWAAFVLSRNDVPGIFILSIAVLSADVVVVWGLARPDFTAQRALICKSRTMARCKRPQC
jgi:hypothetical protein